MPAGQDHLHVLRLGANHRKQVFQGDKAVLDRIIDFVKNNHIVVSTFYLSLGNFERLLGRRSVDGFRFAVI
jgi:hypothetical protein